MKKIKVKVTNRQIREVVSNLIDTLQVMNERVNVLQLAVEQLLREKQETPAVDPAPDATSKL